MRHCNWLLHRFVPWTFVNCICGRQRLSYLVGPAIQGSTTSHYFLLNLLYKRPNNKETLNEAYFPLQTSLGWWFSLSTFHMRHTNIPLSLSLPLLFLWRNWSTYLRWYINIRLIILTYNRYNKWKKNAWLTLIICSFLHINDWYFFTHDKVRTTPVHLMIEECLTRY